MPKLFLLFKCSCLSTPEVDKCIVIPVRMLLTEFLSHRVSNNSLAESRLEFYFYYESIIKNNISLNCKIFHVCPKNINEKTYFL